MDPFRTARPPADSYPNDEGLRIETRHEPWRNPDVLGQWVAIAYWNGTRVAMTVAETAMLAEVRARLIAREKLGAAKVPR